MKNILLIAAVVLPGLCSSCTLFGERNAYYPDGHRRTTAYGWIGDASTPQQVTKPHYAAPDSGRTGR